MGMILAFRFQEYGQGGFISGFYLIPNSLRQSAGEVMVHSFISCLSDTTSKKEILMDPGIYEERNNE